MSSTIVESPMDRPRLPNGVSSATNAIDETPEEISTPSRGLQDSREISPAALPEFPLRPKQSPQHGGASTPPPRRSIQFARDTDFQDASANPPAPPIPETPTSEAASASKQRETLKSRMRSFGLQMKPPTHLRTRSSVTMGADYSNVATPTAAGTDYAADTDGEMGDSSVSPSPAPFTFAKRKRKAPREQPDWYQSSEPETPMENAFDGSRATHSQSPVPTRRRRPQPMRRATMTDVPEHQGVSEDEGRARLAQSPGWKRRSSAWLQNTHGQSFIRNRRPSKSEEQTDRRGLKRLRRTGTDNEETPKGLRITDAREKWRRIGPKVMTAMKMRSRKKETGVDYVKSAELMAELLAGSPAAIIFASHFQPDELRKKKVPVLLEQLKIRIPSAEKQSGTTERHTKFNIELEYGNGLMRMEWKIERYLTDFVNLHVKYTGSKLTDWRNRGAISGPKKLPRFPKSSFPMAKNMVGASLIPDDDDGDKDTEKPEAEAGDESGMEGPAMTPGPREGSHQRRFSSQHMRTYSSGAIRGLSRFPGRSNTAEMDQRKEEFSARQRRKLETYLREMIRYFMFRGGSNRLCRFLEISALGVHLAAEGGYHGKEGMLHIKSPGTVKGVRHSKWFLVRESYIAEVESPEELVLLDVFLVDPEFHFQSRLPRVRDQKTAKDMAKTAKANTGKSSNHRLRLQNRERKITLFAKNERQQEQFAASINKMWLETPWAKPHRFASFAPVRENVHAEWLVDARDYMWKLSRAIANAENSVYIHDWWLSPELYLRRPPSVSQKWRLDRLLKRKAEQGVKIFVIMYRNINSAIPIDSEYSKHALLDLHPNIHVQRSPNQVYQNVFFWAHHEKICVVDNIVGFCGGVDLCFGRWDTPDHVLIDEKPTGYEPEGFARNADTVQIWPGKDYSNPRVQDFFNLDEPYEEMYNRHKVPRMPWHDIGMQLIGQPARDLARHFVQRWNYLLRQRKGPRRRGPTRPMPTLLPPPDLRPQDMENMRLTGTCQVQMLRSCSEWSLGTPDKTEKSIQNAYLKLIEKSEHFVYIENQFFVSSCWVEGTAIRNKIGDALVERIIRAHENDEDWAAVIVIPLMPGFQNAVDEADGTSVRLIMECQYRSICRGDSSIFSKLRAAGIDPHDYIQFYSLRQWGKIGPTKALTTEQLYIHAKCMIVDDRSVIIGSANINERSMNGDRDSEVAACVNDTVFVDSTMAGQPYKVAKFAHSLRVRLMREHLGLDVDGLRSGEVEDWSASKAVEELGKAIRRDDEDVFEGFGAPGDVEIDIPAPSEPSSSPTQVQGSSPDRSTSTNGSGEDAAGTDGRHSRILQDGREVLVGTGAIEGKGTIARPHKSTVASTGLRVQSPEPALKSTSSVMLPPPMPPRMQTQELGLTQLSQLPPLPQTDDSDIGGPPVKTFTQISASSLNAFISEIARPVVEDNCMKDPLTDSFLRETWHKVAESNTRLYRQVFRCMPDNDVQTWEQYRAFTTYSDRFNEAQGIGATRERVNSNTPSKTGPPGTGTEDLLAKVTQLNSSSVTNTSSEKHSPEAQRPRLASAAALDAPSVLRLHTANSYQSQAGSDGTADVMNENGINEKQFEPMDERKKTIEFGEAPSKENISNADTLNEKAELTSTATLNTSGGGTKRRRRATTKSSLLRGGDPLMAKEDAEELLKLIQGRLVVFPYNWLEKENWFFNVDRMAPLEIYD